MTFLSRPEDVLKTSVSAGFIIDPIDCIRKKSKKRVDNSTIIVTYLIGIRVIV